MSNLQPDHRFNHIYKKLVKESGDLVGLFAYSIYKQEKINYIIRFCEEHEGKHPSLEELADFHRMSMGRCDQYRALAESNINILMSALYDSAVADLDSLYAEKLKQKLTESKPSFWAGVLQSLTGSILFTVFLGCVVLLILGFRSGLSGIFAEAVKILTGQ